ncbi:MAG: hypothetical protein ABH871_08345 [Pseudomonadota bacterium]
MAFVFDQFDVMEHLWKTLDKTPDGNHILYTELDIIHLWLMGFVDTDTVSLDEWKSAFEPLRQPDHTFLLNKENFLDLDRYRYKGEIHVPFDAMQINEGKYTDDGFEDLVNASIAPSCSLPPDKLKEFVDALKKDFRQSDNLILIKKEAKSRIKTLLNKNPSPLRNLELILDQMIRTRGKEIESEIDMAELDAKAIEAAKQASSFSAAPTTKSEAKAKGLEALTKAKRKEEPAEVEGKSKTELKKIKRSRKGMRG